MFAKQAITKKLNVPSEKVWDAISKIGRLDVWFPFIETCKVEGDGPGALRYMTIADGGGDIKDTIEEIDSKKNEIDISSTNISISRDLLQRNSRSFHVL